MGLDGATVLNGFPGRPCHFCKTHPAAVYCRPDSAFLCVSCDAKIHCANKLASRHERVWMCEICEQAPAVVMCKADAAALCVTCDAEIHSANPLASRHERVPVEPFFDTAESVVKSSSVLNFLVPNETNVCLGAHHHEEVEVASWLLSNSSFNSKLVHGPEIKPLGGDHLFFTEMDSFIDFEYPNSVSDDHNDINDSVVPVQTKPHPTPVINHSHSPENCYDIDFCRSKLNSFGYQPQSLSHSVSSSSLDVGVVPQANSMSEISYPMGQTVDSGLPLSGSGNQATQLCGIDREARVLRYREKRKNRKFEKTVRYASRKAYAETRPRIKGRFAKRTDMVSEVDEIYGSAASPVFLTDAQYGIVPTF
ncbi:zinc finger protein CONSTANS-LIKE 5 [Cucumis melo var. makuwa]|uniref:Zinc finger protein CONSTANS-LIKE 5 n=1 Tax=Cucumis melo var. makuwa TaxID=1194695 RepID=A0A5D3CCD2_CUCMM|nr:zinc finger protein CONSTANS-LIKE 5 [Cucumis melo var. makuwa]